MSQNQTVDRMPPPQVPGRERRDCNEFRLQFHYCRAQTAQVPASARIAKSTSRLNSDALYNTNAWPSMGRARTRCFRIVEGLWLSGSGSNEALFPQSKHWIDVACALGGKERCNDGSCSLLVNSKRVITGQVRNSHPPQCQGTAGKNLLKRGRFVMGGPIG